MMHGQTKIKFMCKTAYCTRIPTVQQRCSRDLIRYSSADRKDNRMSTEERPQHSIKQQYYTEKESSIRNVN